ncbi:MAG: PTS sugar transporter subunit IIC, partial [Bacillaceae bacterium]
KVRIYMKERVNAGLQILSESIILFLAPAAMLTTIGYFIEIPYVGIATKVLNMMVCGYLGYKLSERANGTKIANITTMIIALLTSRAIGIVDEQVVLKLGDLITAIIMSVLTIYIIRFIGQAFGNYSILLVTPLSIILLIPIGSIVFEGSSIVVGFIAQTIQTFTELQPFLMGGLLAISFGLLIVSPFSSVAVASILGVTGIVAGAASIGIVLIGLGLFFASIKPNGFIKSLAILIGSPKIMMQNALRKPVILAPYMITMFLIGGLFATIGVTNTTQGAGFGSVGFVGVVDFFISNNQFSFIKQLLLIGVIPIVSSILLTVIAYKTGIIKQEDMKLKLHL